MSAKSWLKALKATIEEEPRPPRDESREPIPPTVQKVRKPRGGAGGKVADTRTARPGFSPRDEEERRLLAAGWKPKERMGLVMWADPETGFYCSRKVALHRLANPLGVSPYRRLLDALGRGGRAS